MDYLVSIIAILLFFFFYLASATDQPFTVKAGAILERIFGHEDKTKPPGCMNRVSWTLYDDRFLGGGKAVCDACLLAGFNPRFNAAIPIEKPAIFRPACRVYRKPHYVDVIDMMVASHRERFKNRLEVEIRTIMAKSDAAIVKIKAEHLGETFAEALVEARSGWQVEAIMFMDDRYFVRLVRGRQHDVKRIRCELVDDVLDSSKPRPESRAKFEGCIQQAVQELKGWGKEQDGEGEV